MEVGAMGTGVIPHPQKYDLPHEEWRPYQYETVKDILGNGFGVTILEAQTGSGKSSVAKSLGAQDRSVTALTMTHMLQQQYVDLYDFTELRGSSNYPCEYNSLVHADMCKFLPRRYDCPVASACAYLIQRELYQAAQYRSLNYDYFALAEWLRDKQTHWLVGDEAHRIPSWLSDHLTINLTRGDCTDLRIPQYPFSTINSNPIRLRKILIWLQKAVTNLEYEIGKLQRIASNPPKVIAKINFFKNHVRRFNDAIVGIEESPEDWYCIWDDERIKITPLDVSKFFHPIFQDGYEHRILLMSATIGNPKTYARALGIDTFSHKTVPSIWSTDQRKVYTWKDAPAMNYHSTPAQKAKQADIIANQIMDLPRDWAGIIHVQSKYKARQLGDRLAQRGLEDRLYKPKGMTTAEKLLDIQRAKQKHGNPIVVDYSIGEGADLGGYQINIAADTPFPYIGDEIGRTKMERDRDYYLWETAIGVIQRAGRTRRGREEDYGDTNGFVAVADNSVWYVQGQLSADFVSTMEII
jgi:Rad3-related DNA helicase